MNLLIGEIFMGLSSLGLLCFLGLLRVKSLYITNYILRLVSPLIGIFIVCNLALINFEGELFNSTILIDSFYVNYKLFILLLVGGIYNFSLNYFYLAKIKVNELGVLFLLSSLGTVFILMANDFFFLYLALELQNLGFYILVALKKYNSYSVEAGVKYYIMGSLSSGLFLFGVVLLYGLFGTLNFYELHILLENVLYLEQNFLWLIISFSFILTGIFFKLGIVPFHWWVPDVYSGAPIIVTMFISSLPKLGLIFILVKLLINFNSLFVLGFDSLLLFFGLWSLIVGFIFALYEYNVMRFIAYSSIFNVGFCLVGLSLLSISSIYSVIFFFFTYMILLVGSLSIFILVSNQHLTQNLNLLSLSILSKSNKFLGIGLSFFFFSFGGIPPLAGFFSKLFIFYSIIENEFFILAVIIFCLSAISSFYYFRFIRVLFFSALGEYQLFFLSNNYLLSFIIFLNLSFFFYYDVFYMCFFNLINYVH